MGDQAPDFTLRDQHGADVTLSALRGRPVVLVFYPWAFSNVCTGELTGMRDRAEELTAREAVVLAVSCDPVYSLRAFADRERIEFSLLSDFWPHGEVASAYAVLDAERGCPTRSTYVVDRAGAVAWRVHNPLREARDLDELIGVLERLPVASGASRGGPK